METTEQKFQAICSRLGASSDHALLRPAYELALRAHGAARRSGGEPFIHHVLNTAAIVANWGLSPEYVAVALLHDAKDAQYTQTPVSHRELRALLGAGMAASVLELQRLGSIQEIHEPYGAYENMVKLLEMTEDLRVLLVKLASGMELARNLPQVPDERKRKKRAQFLRSVYSPLAARLGMWQYKRELEDLCLQAWQPEEYAHLLAWRTEAIQQKKTVINEFMAQLRCPDIEPVERHLYGLLDIYHSHSQERIEPRSLRAILSPDQAFRLVVLSASWQECYRILGQVHEIGTPTPRLIKDYLAAPKPNGYASLDTTIQFQGARLEVSIRTPVLNVIAQQGVTAAVVQKAWSERATRRPATGLLQDPQGVKKSVRVLIHSLLQQAGAAKGKIYVRAPDGDLFTLPKGASVLDFAYAIHSEVGNQFGGAVVNGSAVPISYILQEGDIVDVAQQTEAFPQIDWLNIVVTKKAKQSIRRFFRMEPGARGQLLLVRALARRSLNWDDSDIRARLENLATPLYGGVGPLCAAIGSGEIAADEIVTQFYEQLEVDYWYTRLVLPPEMEKISEHQRLEMRMANCCTPIYPDRIIGSVRNHHITVHRYNCPNSQRGQRRIPIEWRVERPIEVALQLFGLDRPRLVLDVANTISSQALNMDEFLAEVSRSGHAVIRIRMKLPNRVTLGYLIQDLEAIESITNVEALEDGQRIRKEFFQEQIEKPGQPGGAQRANPYSPGVPIRERAMFFGRKRELRRILNYILPAGRPTNLFLVAQRRVGKTSLAIRVAGDQHVRHEYIPVMVDLSFYKATPERAFLDGLRGQISRETARYGFSPEESLPPTNEPYSDFEQYLYLLQDHFLRYSKRKRLLLVLDEFDTILLNLDQGLLSERFLSVMRAWSQNQPITFILVGSSQIQDRLHQLLPGFLNVFLADNLGPLDLYDARLLITKPVLGDLYFEPQAQDKILSLSARYPYYIHLICAKLFSQADERDRSRVAVADLDSVIQDLSSHHSAGYYTHLWHPADEMHKRVLACLAHSPADPAGWVDLAEILCACSWQERPPLALETLEALYRLDTLEKRLEAGHTFYRIKIPLFKEWLRCNLPAVQFIRKEIP